jgi:hypothetical protein
LAALLAFGRAGAGLRVFVRELAAAVAVSVAAVLTLTIGTRVAAGAWPDWNRYFAYILVYSVDEIVAIPLDFWSPALLMAAAIFLSAVGVVSIARDERIRASGPVLAGLAGFTGFAISTFTYFLGRAHPNNLLNLLVPMCAIGCLWASTFLPQRGEGFRAWRMVPLFCVLVAAASLIFYGGSFALVKWHQTALAQAVPFAAGQSSGNSGLPLRASLEDLWAGRTYHDEMVDNGAGLLQRYDPGTGPALVAIPQRLDRMWVTTEVLLSAGRVNLLPISNPEQDSLILPRVWPRIAAAVEAVPDGTILLTSVPQPQTGPPILQRVLGELQRRFQFQVLESSPYGLQVVRLHSHS